MAQVDSQHRNVPSGHLAGSPQKGPVSSQSDKEVDPVLERSLDFGLNGISRGQDILKYDLDPVLVKERA
jgi:hypothetical protein